MPFRAETVQGYVRGACTGASSPRPRCGWTRPPRPRCRSSSRASATTRTSEPLRCSAPGVIALLLVFIPAVLTALGVVREKELGSITNLYVTPTRRWEFLLGKQLPYVALAMLNFALLVTTAVFLSACRWRAASRR